jgi:hypothetical protein
MLVAARRKASVCSRLPAGIAGSNSAGSIDVLSLVSVVCCQIEVCTTGIPPVQRSPTEYGVYSECGREAPGSKYHR